MMLLDQGNRCRQLQSFCHARRGLHYGSTNLARYLLAVLYESYCQASYGPVTRSNLGSRIDADYLYFSRQDKS